MRQLLLLPLALCLASCANTYKPPASGELVDLEIFSRSLVTRNAFYADETITVYIENKSPNGTSGSMRLTVEEPRRKTKVVANQPIIVRLGKAIPRMGTLLFCTGEIPLTPLPNTSYSVEFHYSVNYENDTTTPCYVDITQVDLGSQMKSTAKAALNEHIHQFRYKFVVK